MFASESIQSIPSPQLWFPVPIGPNLVPAGTRYNVFGRYLLAAGKIIAGATYVWTGTGGESCQNDGNPVSSGVAFVAINAGLDLFGTANDFVLATVQRVNRPG